MHLPYSSIISTCKLTGFGNMFHFDIIQMNVMYNQRASIPHKTEIINSKSRCVKQNTCAFTYKGVPSRHGHDTSTWVHCI